MLAFEMGGWGKVGRVPSSTFTRWPEFVDDLRTWQRSGTGRHLGFDEMVVSDLLTIDDIGADDDPWKGGSDKLCQLLTRREKEFTVVTTNIEPAHWPEKFDIRIADRLMRNSEVVNLFGLESYAFVQN